MKEGLLADSTEFATKNLKEHLKSEKVDGLHKRAH